MPDWHAIEDPTDRLHGFVSGFHATYYVYTGVTCGLFEALTEPQTPTDLAANRNLHQRYVRQFCEIGLRWGLLETDLPAPDAAGDSAPQFRLDDRFVDALAAPGAPQYMGDFFRFLGDYQSEDYASYPTAFETGTRQLSENRGPAFTAAIEESTRGLQDIFLKHLLPDLSAFESRLDRGGRILDVGCGTGRLICRLCKCFPDIEGIGVDLDGDAVNRARERADRQDLADRTTFLVQDATTIDGTFTMAIFFMSVHEIDLEKRQSLFDHLGDALTDNGVIVVFDEVYPEQYDQFTCQPFTAGVETQWAELTWGADVPTKAEHRDLLAAAGCVERVSRTVADRFIVYEGVKE